MKQVDIDNTLFSDFDKHTQDAVSNAFLSHYHLFSAVSTLLVGDESRSIELRYRCCIEMVTNKAKSMSHQNYARIELHSMDYDKDCLMCAKPSSYSTAWRIQALSNLLKIPIESVYPCVNGSKHMAFLALNTVFQPPSADPAKKITVMWTHTNLPIKSKSCQNRREWVPNHFVPLVDTERKQEAPHRCILPSFLEL